MDHDWLDRRVEPRIVEMDAVWKAETAKQFKELAQHSASVAEKKGVPLHTVHAGVGRAVLHHATPQLIDLLYECPDPGALALVLEQVQQGLKSVARDRYQEWAAVL